MRILALDGGQKRTGVAVSDPTGLLASPLAAITSKAASERVESVLTLSAEQAVGEIVVGMPVSLSGRKGPQAEWVAGFVRELSARSAVPVKTFDERYTSVEAKRLLRQAGVQPSREKARVDSAAAAVLLQAYLDSKKAGREG